MTVQHVYAADRIGVDNTDPTNPILSATNLVALQAELAYYQTIGARIPAHQIRFWLDAASRPSLSVTEEVAGDGAGFADAGWYWVTPTSVFKNYGTIDKPRWTNTTHQFGHINPNGSVSGAIGDAYVKRSSGDAYQDLYENTDGGTTWVSHNVETVVAGGTPVNYVPSRVVVIRDRSGNGFDFTTELGNEAPSYDPASLNGLDTLAFNGNECLSLSAGLGNFLNRGGSSVYAVVKSSQAVNQEPVLASFYNNGGPGYALDAWHAFFSSAAVLALANGNTSFALNDGTAPDTWSLLSAVVSPTLATQLRVGGVAASSEGHDLVGGNSAIAQHPLVLGAGQGDGGDLFANGGLVGNIAEVIAYESAHSAYEVAQVEAYLTAKWGL